LSTLAGDAFLPPHLALASSKLVKRAVNDPTANLLLEAANQLRELVREQVMRQTLRLQRRHSGTRRQLASGDSDDSTGDSSDGEAEAEPTQARSAQRSPAKRPLAPDGGADADQPSSNPSQYSVSVASALNSGAAASSGPLDSGQSSQNKRLCLQRQYAINLSGQCLLGGELLPLPPPPGTVS
jgi:hypothetical protein